MRGLLIACLLLLPLAPPALASKECDPTSTVCTFDEETSVGECDGGDCWETRWRDEGVRAHVLDGEVSVYSMEYWGAHQHSSPFECGEHTEGVFGGTAHAAEVHVLGIDAVALTDDKEVHSWRYDDCGGPRGYSLRSERTVGGSTAAGGVPAFAFASAGTWQDDQDGQCVRDGAYLSFSAGTLDREAGQMHAEGLPCGTLP